jgi:hypothetical protein
MVIIKTGKKGKHFNNLEKYIYKISKDNQYMNDTYTDTTPYSRPCMNTRIAANTLIPPLTSKTNHTEYS